MELALHGRWQRALCADGQLVFNTITLTIDMALAGLGLAYLPEDQVSKYLASGRLVRSWAIVAAGFRLPLIIRAAGNRPCVHIT
jgi:DNA-binding transcriptional LysR family regulator